MKLLSLTILIASFSISLAYAQKQAQLDNNQFITVVRTQKATGRTQEIHYTLTNKNSVSMDFSLYKELTNGSWDIAHHLDLQPGQTYEDVSGFTGVSGKYVLYSAPHSDWASFPSFMDIAKLQAGAATASATPAPAQAASPAPSAAAAKQSPASSPSNNNSAPPIPPPM